jgi:hypothetical protein
VREEVHQRAPLPEPAMDYPERSALRDRSAPLAATL